MCKFDNKKHKRRYRKKCRQQCCEQNDYCYNKPRVVGPCLFGNATYIYAGQTTMNLCC